MSIYRVTFFFQSVEAALAGPDFAAGWTETHYLERAASIDAILTDPAVQTYIIRRLACLPASRSQPPACTLGRYYSMPFLRVSDVVNPRITKIKALQGQIGNAAYPGPIPPANSDDRAYFEAMQPAQVQCALLVDGVALGTATNEKSHHRRFLLRGLTRGDCAFNVYDTSSHNYPNITQFLLFLFGSLTVQNPASPGAFGALTQDPNVAPQVITALAINPDTFTLSITSGLGALVAGDRIRISGVKNMVGVNRTWTVLQSAAGPPYQLGTSRSAVFGSFIPGPRCRAVKFAPVVRLYSQAAIIGLRTKKTGRLFRQLVGRSRRRT